LHSMLHGRDVGAGVQPRVSTGRSIHAVPSVDAIRSALEAAGAEFTNGDQPGVRLKKAAKSQR
jgi:hypothetical protein